MKKLFVAILAIGLLSVSCKKEESTPTTPGTGIINPKKFYLKLDGQEYTTEFGSSQNTSGLIIFGTSIGSNVIFQLAISDTLTPGTYPITTGGVFNVGHSDDNYATSGYSSISGSVTIVSHNVTTNKISGTYNCVLQKQGFSTTKNLTNGEFNITYP